jgi:hypothetical protein
MSADTRGSAASHSTWIVEVDYTDVPDDHLASDSGVIANEYESKARAERDAKVARHENPASVDVTVRPAEE